MIRTMIKFLFQSTKFGLVNLFWLKMTISGLKDMIIYIKCKLNVH